MPERTDVYKLMLVANWFDAKYPPGALRWGSTEVQNDLRDMARRILDNFPDGNVPEKKGD